MKNSLQTILTIFVILALVIRAIGLYDLFYGIELFQRWILEDYGETISRLDFFYYGSTILLFLVALNYSIKFRKEKKLYNDIFFSLLMILFIPDFSLSFILYCMSGPFPIS